MTHFLDVHPCSSLQCLQLTDVFLCSAHSWTEPALQVSSAADWSSWILPHFFHRIKTCMFIPEWHLRYFLFLFYPSTEGHHWFMFRFRSITTQILCPAEALLNQLLSLTYLCGWLFVSKDLRLSNLINIICLFFLFSDCISSLSRQFELLACPPTHWQFHPLLRYFRVFRVAFPSGLATEPCSQCVAKDVGFVS